MTSRLLPFDQRRVVARCAAFVFVCALVGVACGDDGPATNGEATTTDVGADVDTAPNDETSAPPDTDDVDLSEEIEATYTWYRDIAPLLETHCGSCHLPGGQGTGDFTDPQLVESFAPAILASVAAGRMPPPASDPACQDYIGADRWVVPDDFGTRIQTWIDEGHVRGSAAEYVPVPPIATRLDDANLEVRIPQPYRPTFEDPANPGNEYRCFVVEHGRDETFYIQKMAPIVDRPELVHHIVLFKARRHDIPAQNDPLTGYDCINMTFFVGSGGPGTILSGDSGMISAWAPGSQAIDFGSEYGVEMEPDHVFIMQIHYFNGAPDGAEPDFSGYEFTVDDQPRRPIIMLPFGPTGFRIPAGDSAYELSTTLRIPLQIRIHGVMPHMHYLGQSYRMWFGEGEDEVCLASSERYDFENQLTYMFPEPIVIPAQTPIGFGCVWNNSTSNPNLIHDPPQEIRYGERTDEEMCFGFSLLSVGR